MRIYSAMLEGDGRCLQNCLVEGGFLLGEDLCVSRVRQTLPSVATSTGRVARCNPGILAERHPSLECHMLNSSWGRLSLGSSPPITAFPFQAAADIWRVNFHLCLLDDTGMECTSWPQTGVPRQTLLPPPAFCLVQQLSLRLFCNLVVVA